MPITESGQADRQWGKDAGEAITPLIYIYQQWRMNLSHRTSFQFKPVGVVDKAISDRIGDSGIVMV